MHRPPIELHCALIERDMLRTTCDMTPTRVTHVKHDTTTGTGLAEACVPTDTDRRLAAALVGKISAILHPPCPVANDIGLLGPVDVRASRQIVEKLVANHVSLLEVDGRHPTLLEVATRPSNRHAPMGSALVQQLAVDPTVIQVVQQYLGSAPVLTSVERVRQGDLGGTGMRQQRRHAAFITY
jgi:hypothetical protein